MLSYFGIENTVDIPMTSLYQSVVRCHPSSITVSTTDQWVVIIQFSSLMDHLTSHPHCDLTLLALLVLLFHFPSTYPQDDQHGTKCSTRLYCTTARGVHVQSREESLVQKWTFRINTQVVIVVKSFQLYVLIESRLSRVTSDCVLRTPIRILVYKHWVVVTMLYTRIPLVTTRSPIRVSGSNRRTGWFFFLPSFFRRRGEEGQEGGRWIFKGGWIFE